MTASPAEIERPIYQLEELNRKLSYEKPHSTIGASCGRVRKSVKPLSFLKRTIPIVTWLPEYNWQRDFLGDVISGITVGIMHIPQGMAYALLGNVPPIVGIYMAFFPVLVYFMFGTSRHVSIGTFSIVCLMTGKVVTQHSTAELMSNGTVKLFEDIESGQRSYTNIEVAVATTFAVAVIQLSMYVLRLGIVSQLLSDTLVSGFICASAFHVVASQVKDLLGLLGKKRRGNFSVVFTVYDSLVAIYEANLSALVISLVACVAMSANNELLKPWLARKTRMPIPIELIAVLIGTAVSYSMNLEARYGISVVGKIPLGLPGPSLPAFSLIPEIFLDSIVITLVGYSVTLSMALIFARELMYEVDPNQELLAMGLANTMGSFFSCLPISASLSRSMVQKATGGVTQLASVVSCLVLLLILLWIGPLFETLPRCVLASIIVIAIKGMLLECSSIVKYWQLSKWDAFVWIVTFTITLFVQISYGLAAGLIVSLLSIFIQSNKPYVCLLGGVPNTDLYLDIRRYKRAKQIKGLKIFHYSGGLSFVSRDSFKEVLFGKTNLDAADVLRKKVKLQQRGLHDERALVIKCIIIDFTCVTFIDPAGVEGLRSLHADYAKLGVWMYIAGCSAPVYEVIVQCDKVEKKKSKFLVFPTVHDAVLYAKANVLSARKF